MKTSYHSAARKPRGAFALVITLLMLSLLVIVSVSYLTSMTAERQTANAYDSKAVAEQAAQTGVDNATAMLAQCFRDFPDSATVWDTTQTTNSGTPYNASVIVGGSYNEGTSLYLRAVPSTQDTTAYAVALPHGTLNAADGTPYPSNDPAGNDPNNPACKTFVLPLISGVLNGQARLVGSKTSMFPSSMDLHESDPAKQTWTDLNVRRASGDIQGGIGSRPGWTGVGPEPARAYWVNLKGSDGRVNARYAFWMEDDSFRLNTSFAGATGQTPADAVWPKESGTLRSLQPGDLTIAGLLTRAANSDPGGNAVAVVNTRSKYPGGFFPDPLAFAHGSVNTTAVDTLRYLTTNQSGTLNLSRHGSQRLNLNTAIFTPPATTPEAVTAGIQKQVNDLVQTLEFHLPNFGERFYRTSNVAGLNDATQVPGSPYPLPNNNTPYATATNGTPVTDGSYSQIYYYKVAANLRDYIDKDSQPTMIGTGGTIMAAPTISLGDTFDSGAEPNSIWAQGKESAPFIQEVAVRYRPVVTTVAKATATNPKGHYQLNVDYYIEFWNMSDRDISASQMGDLSLWVREQQRWAPYLSTYLLQADSFPPNGETLSSGRDPADLQLDLTGKRGAVPVKDAMGTVYQDGVLFRAGAVTIVTDDPDAVPSNPTYPKGYTYTELQADGTTGSNGKTNNPHTSTDPKPGLPNLQNVFICPVISGSRTYSGKITRTDGSTASNGGIELGGNFQYTSPYTGTEVSLVNSQGYFDVVRGAITKTGAIGYNVYCANDTNVGKQGNYNDYSYGSSLMGNVSDQNGGPAVAGTTVQPVASSSQVGDPRTNNEQLWVNVGNYTSADGTRFMAASRTLGSPNYIEVVPDTTTTKMGWPDYYKFPAGASTSPDATTAPAVVAGAITTDGPLTSIGQLGDIFDPARSPGADIRYSHGGGRTFKIGQHDDLYSSDPTTNVYSSNNSATNTADNVSASSGWASWRLADIFDVADPIQLPGRININGIMRDNGAAFLSTLQGFLFQPKTGDGTSDPAIHGDASSGLAKAPLDTTGTSNGFSQIILQMQQRLDAAKVPADADGIGRVKPFFERGELGELGGNSLSPLFGINPTSSSPTNTTLVSSVDMDRTNDHSREEIFRRLAQMICTRGNTFTVYTVGQSITQSSATSPLKITGTQRLRVTFRLVPKAKDSGGSTYTDFHPAYVINSTTGSISQNTFEPSTPTKRPASTDQVDTIGVIPRFAKPDRYDIQILEVVAY